MADEILLILNNKQKPLVDRYLETVARGGLRTTAAKRFKKVENATALTWKLLQVAESTFRRLKGAELLPAVYAGARYVEGVARTLHSRPQLAA